MMSTKSWQSLLGTALLILGAAACGSTVDGPDADGGQGGQGANNGGTDPGGTGPGGTGVGGTGAGGTGTGAGGTGGSGGTGGTGGVGPIEPVEATATNIKLHIYSDGWGDLLETVTVDTEGPYTISVEEEFPYYEPPQYYIYATADGFYTELYYCTKGEIIDVDLDAVPKDAPNAIAGVIFGMQWYFADSYVADYTVQLDGQGISMTLTTDAQGRYGVQGLPLGDYTITFDYGWSQVETITLHVTNESTEVDYADLSFYEPEQMS